MDRAIFFTFPAISRMLGGAQLSLLDRDLQRVVEPGEFLVMFGHSSQDIRLKESLYGVKEK